MGLPTLLQKGFVIPPTGASKAEKARIKNMTGSEYLMNFLSDRIPLIPNGQPKIKPKGIGDKVMVLKSGTGSGKSTVIPPVFYEKFQDRTRKNIAVTQPRVLTAKEIAEGTPENYPFMKIDVNLGFSTGNIKRMPSDKGVIYMTIGTLLQQLINLTNEEFIRKYSLIVVDEVHDRSIDVDITLYKLKKILELHYESPSCPIIILMSATFNPKIFLEYFNCPASNYMEFLGATFPIEANFPKYDIPNYIEYAINKAEELHVKNISDIDENSDFRDILIFVQGASQVKKILAALHLFNAKILNKPMSEVNAYIDSKKNSEKQGGSSTDKRYHIAPIELTSSSFGCAGTEYQNLFSPINNIMVPIYNLDDKGNINIKSIQRWIKPTRRIIVATNVAETGVTIETLKYCIDTGFLFSVEFNPDFGSKLMLGKNITKGMALQRKGRVGRKSPGNWYPCYTESVFNNLNEDQFADILRSDTTTQLLNIIITETESQMILADQVSLEEYKKEKNFFVTNYLSNHDLYTLRHIKPLNFSAIDLFEIPAANSLIYSFEKLYSLGFIDSSYNPTVLGLYSKGFSKISMENIKMMLSGYSHGANILDLITITAFITVGNRFIYSKKYKTINVLKPIVTDKDYEFYYKTIIGDQFIEYLLVWELYSEFLNKMMEEIRKKSKKNQRYIFSIKKIEEWCVEHQIEYSGLVMVTTVRNELIASIISMGLNPYYNGMNLEPGVYNLLNILKNNLEDGVVEIKKIKKCIFDGYRLNMVIWDDTSKKYILHHRNIPVQIIRNNLLSRMGDDAVQRNANFIVVSEIMLSESQKNPGIYEFQTSDPISIIDTIDIDLKFLLH
jgi:HrpA-like RNA helicase